MSWDDRILGEKDLSPFINGDSKDLSNRVLALIEHQKHNWPMLRDGYDAFRAIETKRLHVDEAEVVVQHNPRRIQSSGARVDKQSISSRPCFLCPQNLPPEEKGLAFGEFVILCNPYPVLDRHLSIVDRNHGEQKIAGNVSTLLSLSRELGSEYFVLYNGPECGASAPDHLHFQACSNALLPISDHLFDNEPLLAEDCSACEETASNTFELFTLGGCGRTTVVLRGGNQREVESWVYRFIDEFGKINEKQEPMINLISTYSGRIWTIYIFPRARHRPAAYFAEGSNRLLISPGAIDMAGVVVVPERSDFERLDGSQLSQIYREVSYNEEIINDMLDWMTSAQETFFRD